MNGFEYFFRKISRRRRAIAHYEIDDNEVTVIDESYLFGLYPSMRILDGGIGWYSAIYNNKRKINQPYLHGIQKLIEDWAEGRGAEMCLVLGSAGCSIPRFLNLRYPESHVVCVDYSPEMLKIADEYFLGGLDRTRMELVLADALAFVGQDDHLYDICVLDLFVKNKIVEGIFEDQFLAHLSERMKDNSIVLVNCFSESHDKLQSFREHALQWFDDAYIVEQENMAILVLKK